MNNDYCPNCFSNNRICYLKTPAEIHCRNCGFSEVNIPMNARALGARDRRIATMGLSEPVTAIGTMIYFGYSEWRGDKTNRIINVSSDGTFRKTT